VIDGALNKRLFQKSVARGKVKRR